MNRRLRTCGAYLLLLAFVLGGVVAPHVHQVRHATEAADIVHHTSDCENASHDADAPTATGHFHDVEIPDCVLCATHHTFTAVVPDHGSVLEPFVRSTHRSTQAHVSASTLLSIEIRGPPVWAA
jgi:hypothetical protein